MKLKIKVPLTTLEPSDEFKEEIVKTIPKIIRNYGDKFKIASSLSGVPTILLYSVAMQESRGNHYYPSGKVIVTGGEKSTGMMQISANNFYEVYRKELKGGRVPTLTKIAVDKFLPNMDYTSQPATSQQKELISKALTNLDFNILASSLVIRYLLDKTIDSDGTARIDKVILLYNAGEYHKATKTPNYQRGDTTSLIKVVPDITKGYIRNIAGKNGIMYYITANKL